MKQILITSAVLILSILLIRWVLRKRVSKRLIYATWLLVALRLLIPFQFGHSEYSVVAVTERLEQRSEPIRQLEQTLQEPVAGPSREELYQQTLQDYQPQTQQPLPSQPTQAVTPEVHAEIQQKVEQKITAPTPKQLLTALWIVGMIGMAGWFLVTNILFLRRVKRSATACKDITAPIPIRISPNVATPCLAGLIRPVIYLTPDSVSDPQKQEHVLTHELTHLRHWDHIWSWIRCLCLCVYWFNPLVWIAAIVSKRDCELACDEAALRKLGDAERIAYGKTLLDTVTHSPVHILQTTTAMAETKKQLKERVNYIVKKQKTLWIAVIALIVAVTVTAGLVFTGCKQAKPEPTKPVASSPSKDDSGSSDSSADTKPTNNSDPPYTEPTPQPGPSAEVLATAEDLIYRYMWYLATDVCCDFDSVIVEDMSQHLTSQQKEFYYGQQRRITCCDTADQVCAHIDRALDESLQRADPTDKLFTDGDALYLIILPTEYKNFTDVRITNHTDTYIKATANIRDEDGISGIADFHIEITDTGTRISQVQISDPPPHNHGFVVTTVAPTCTEEGYDLHECELCGHFFHDNFTEKTPHSYQSSTVAPTCREKGHTLYKCKDCGHSYKDEFTQKLEHSYQTSTVAPTCSEKGHTLYKCKDCDHSYKDNFTQKLEHSYQSSTIAPTCTDKGYDLHQCDCGESYKDNYTSATGHDYRTDDSKYFDPATTVKDGFCYMTCKNCKDSYRKTLVAAEGIDLETLVAECEDYARSLGFNVVAYEDYDYSSRYKKTNSVATLYLCLGLENPAELLKQRVINMINNAEDNTTEGNYGPDHYYMYIRVNLHYSLSLTNEYYITVEYGVPN